MSEPTYTLEGLRGVGRVELSFVPDQRVYALFGTNGVGKTKCLEALFQYFLTGSEVFISSSDPNNEIFKTWHSLTNQQAGGVAVAQSVFGPMGQSTYDSITINERVDSVGVPGAFGLKPHVGAVVFLGAGQRGTISSDQSVLQPIGSFSVRQYAYFQSLIEGMKLKFSNLGMHKSIEQWFVTIAQSSNAFQVSSDNREIEIETLLGLLHHIDARFDSNLKSVKIDGDNRVSITVDGVLTELRNLSSGFASLVKILQAIISGYSNFTNEVKLANVEGYVFIDEIESHLHSEWQSKIVMLLKDWFPKTTFFIATHSPIVLSQLQEGEAYLLERKDGVVKTSVIPAPNKRILSDVLVDAMGINLNRLKLARLSSDSQKEIKARIRQLLLETPTERGDA